MMRKSIGIFGTSVLTMVLLAAGTFGIPAAHAVSYVVTIQSGPDAGRQVAIISLSEQGAAAVSAAHAALTAQAALSVSPLSVVLNTTQGVDPVDPAVTIANTGPTGSVLNWSASASDAWIAMSQATGTLASGASSDVVLGAHVAGLLPGTYNGTVTISDPDASNSPQTIAVTLTITAPPAIEQLDASSALGDMNFGGRQKIVVPSAVNMSAVNLDVAYDNTSALEPPETSQVQIFAAGADDSQLGSLLGTSAVVTLNSGESGVRSYTFASPVALPAGTYWIAPEGDATLVFGTMNNPDPAENWFWPNGGPGGEAAYFQVVTQ